MGLYCKKINFQLLQVNVTITADIFCQQLEYLNIALKEKWFSVINRKSVVFHYDNAQLHTTKITSEKIRDLNWENIPHTHFPGLAPSDYYLF